MASRPLGATARRIERLFHLGSVAGMSEVQLLERFVRSHDDAAFEALVERHGPMVLGVCRQWLRDPGDVEDAFQATFLLLVRKAGSLRDRTLLGNWLYGVACRVARRARADRARRQTRESTGVVTLADPRDPEHDEPRPWLHEEVNRLPEKYRAPIVLCYLEGRTHEEAAEQLHWPVGTVKGRLSRARGLLYSRLSRRGLAPAVGVLTTTLTRDASAAVPITFVESTVRVASGLATGKGMAVGLISAPVIALMEGVCQTMLLSKLRVIIASFVVAGLVTASAGVLARQTPGNGSEPAEKDPTTAGANDSLKRVDPRAAGLVPPGSTAVVPSEEPAQPVVATAGRPGGPRERVELARKAIALIETLRKERAAVPPEQEYEWSIRLLEAERQASTNRAERVAAAEAHLGRMKAAMERIAALVERGTASSLDALEAQFRYQQALQGVTDAQADQTVKAQAKGMAAFASASAGRSVPKGAGARSGGGGGGFGAGAGPGGGGFGLANDEYQRRLMIAEKAPRVAAEDPSPQTKEIMKKLETPIAMSFANETPFEDVLKYIKSATAGANDNGIPIYVDPVGLQDAEKTMTSPVILDLEGVPLKTTLRLMLKQLGLAYCVKDGLLIISTVKGIQQELEEAQASHAEPTPLAR